MNKSELHRNHRARMRSRFEKNGLSGFEDHEILEMLLYSSIPRRNTNEIAHELLHEFGSIAGVLSAERKELCTVNGIGEVASGQLRFMGELFGEISREIFGKSPITSPELAGIYSMLRLGTAPAESAVAVYLDGDGAPISEEELYKGTSDTASDMPGHVADTAKKLGACGILLMHNHKHNPEDPSPEDIVITEKLRREAESIGIHNVMHVIVSDNGYAHI